MSVWIDIKNCYPKNDQKVQIKIYDIKTEKIYILDAVFNEDDLTRHWKFTMPEGADIIHLPTEWCAQ